MENFKDYRCIIDELSDRFGNPPSEVYILVELMKIKNLCKKAGVVKLDAGQKGASISFLKVSLPILNFKALKSPSFLKFSASDNVNITFPWPVM